MNTCELAVSAIFILCGVVSYCAIFVKCRGDVTDVERWVYTSRPPWEWYAFRLTSVVVALGALFHSRHLVGEGWRALKARVARL